MREVVKLIDAMGAVDAAGGAAAVATVVGVEGSAYRREGTKMLVHPDGSHVCTISGGCLEQEVAEIARRVMETGEPTVAFFDLEEEVVWGLGLGCGGAVDVYIEPYDGGPAFAAWRAAVRAKRAGALVTVIRADGSPDGSPEGSEGAPELGARMFVPAGAVDAGDAGGGEDDPLAGVVGTLGEEELDRRFARTARAALEPLHPQSRAHALELPGGGRAEVFVDVTTPPPHLTVFGAGHDAIPMVAAARTLGFDVTVVDARPVFLDAERFPGAELVRAHPDRFAERVAIPSRGWVIVMNHHLERDAHSFAFALESDAAYIGLLGPRSRFEKIRDRVRDLGVELDEADLARVRTPIGVDVGADTPEEIAVSVMAELIAVRGGYEAGFLSDREGRVHARLERV